MQTTSFTELACEYQKLLGLATELNEAVNAHHRLPIDRLCDSLTELSFRIQLATFAAHLALLIGSNDERAIERFVKEAVRRKLSFESVLEALCRYQESA